jgi:hypothetical protein
MHVFICYAHAYTTLLHFTADTMIREFQAQIELLRQQLMGKGDSSESKSGQSADMKEKEAEIERQRVGMERELAEHRRIVEEQKLELAEKLKIADFEANKRAEEREQMIKKMDETEAKLEQERMAMAKEMQGKLDGDGMSKEEQTALEAEFKAKEDDFAAKLQAMRLTEEKVKKELHDREKKDNEAVLVRDTLMNERAALEAKMKHEEKTRTMEFAKLKAEASQENQALMQKLQLLQHSLVASGTKVNDLTAQQNARERKQKVGVCVVCVCVCMRAYYMCASVYAHVWCE